MSRIATACPASPAPRPRRWHKIFLGMLPDITAHAKFAFRNLRPEARAEAVQEVVCNALKAFVRLVQLKKTAIAYPTVLASYGVRQTRDGRKVGGHLNVKDVLSKYCQEHKDVVVDRLDHFDTTEEGSGRKSLSKTDAADLPRSLAAESTSRSGSNRCRFAIAASPSTLASAIAPATPRKSSKSRPAASARFARSWPRAGRSSSATSLARSRRRVAARGQRSPGTETMVMDDRKSGFTSWIEIPDIMSLRQRL